MTPETLGYINLASIAAVGVFIWQMMVRMEDRLDRKIDALAKDHQNLARELSELRGEIRGRFDLTPAAGE